MRRLAANVALLAVASWFVGCASTAPERVVSRIPVSEQAYVLDPLTGYPLTVAEGPKQRVRSAYALFDAGGSLTEAAAQADALASEDPAFLPAEVLRAQVDFLNRLDRSTVERLEPIQAELPDYVAATLLLARAYERLGTSLKAYQTFASLAPINRTAASRAEEMKPRAVEIVERRFDDALTKGRPEEAEVNLELLRAWQHDERRLLELERRLLFDIGDQTAELEIVRALLELEETSEPAESSVGVSEEPAELMELQRRLGELEIEVGDVRTGMEIFEDLAAQNPEDPELFEQVERARFLWRLELLPPQIKEIARRPELDRADLASLLYWLFPAVRFSEVDDPPIAADILDHGNRAEILRVLDTDLMSVDETVHRFEPDQGATRRVALAALLTILHRAEAPVLCLQGQLRAAAAERSRRWVCDKAAECGLIGEPTECLPAATLSGSEALDLVRRCLDRLGSS